MPHAATRRVLTAVLLLAALPAAAIYKWVDEKGVTHFSETPPPDGRKATKVEPKVTPPSGPVAPPADWKKREQESRKSRLEREMSDDAARARAHNEAAERANKCSRAKRDLEVLGSQRPVYSRNDRGEKVYVEDKDRPAEIAAARREIEAHCDAR